MILGKCWKMIGGETNELRIAKIAEVALCFGKIKTSRVGHQLRPMIDRMDEAAIASCVAACVKAAPLTDGTV
jgi:hypothetical protein